MGMEETSPNKIAITKDFLEKVLKRKIFDFTASGGSNPGDNYLSVLISLDIIEEDGKEPLHLLFKTFPHHPTRQKLLEDTNLFLKEFLVYDIWLPELRKFQPPILGNDNVLKLAMPEMVAGASINYAKGDPTEWSNMDPMLSNFLLMVDVRKTYGFKMANKLNSLGYHHVQVVLEELAKYHALGHAYKIHNKLSSILTKFPFMEDPFFCPSQRPMLEIMLKMNMQLVMDACKDFLAENEEIAESLTKFMDPVIATDFLHMFLDPNGVDEEKVEGLMRVNPSRIFRAPLKDQWIVAGHGDCWSNNMLFKTGEDGKVKETVLVDLQIARESCVMADLVYFMYSSTDTNFRKEYLDEMLAWYHDRFVHFCTILKVDTFPGFTVENFQRKFHRSKIFGFLFASLILPIILQRPETTVNLDSVEVEGCGGGNQHEEMAEMFGKMGRDEDDAKLLRERFTTMMTELHGEGVL